MYFDSKKNQDWQLVKEIMKKNLPTFQQALDQEMVKCPQIRVEVTAPDPAAKKYSSAFLALMFNRRPDNLTKEDRALICQIVANVTAAVPQMRSMRCSADATERKGTLLFKIGPAKIPLKKRSMIRKNY